jgi:dihydrolipoamide dehydrogenase
MLLKKNKIDKITGFASFVDKNNIIVKSESGETKVNAKNFVIATGSVVSKFPNVEFDEEVIISSKGALEMKKVPEKMIVIGGGVIGMELGSVYSNLGSNVTVIEYADKIIPTFDEDICIAAEKIFVKNGIEIIKSSKVANITKLAKGVKIDFENISTGEKKSIESNVVLISTGRKPCHDGLKIEAAANIKQDSRGFLLVNDKYQISDNIYAIGDVIPGPMLAHKSEEEGVAVADIIAGKHAHINYNAIPSVVYTSPEIASVGFSESELKIKGIGYKIGKFSFAANSRARAVSSEDGFVKIIACEKTDRILGCQIIGKDAGSLIHEVSVLIEFSASSEDLAMCCHAHPTLNEAVKEAALAVSKKAIHS